MNVLQLNIEPYYAEKKLNYSHRMTVFRSIHKSISITNRYKKSAVDYFAVSILGGILSSVKAHFVQQRADIVEMEGKIWLNLANPLTLLGVHGYDEPPHITDCKIKIFISSDLDDQTV